MSSRRGPQASASMVWRNCPQHGIPWLSVAITECPYCTGHGRVPTEEERRKMRLLWRMPRGGVNPRTYERAQGRWASSHAGPTGFGKR